MDLTEDAQEALEKLWIEAVEDGKGNIEKKVIGDMAVLWELSGRDLINQVNGLVKLTKAGKKEAENVIRRHRLAERLFHDLLELDADAMETPACEFEHILISGRIEEAVCILLGHPRECPHGRKIPKGRCCHEKKKEASQVIHPLSELKEGRKARVVYIRTEDHSKLQKLMAMGVLPGSTVTMIQRYPSFVFSVGRSQVAVDNEIAREIQVRLVED